MTVEDAVIVVLGVIWAAIIVGLLLGRRQDRRERPPAGR